MYIISTECEQWKQTSWHTQSVLAMGRLSSRLVCVKAAAAYRRAQEREGEWEAAAIWNVSNSCSSFFFRNSKCCNLQGKKEPRSHTHTHTRTHRERVRDFDKRLFICQGLFLFPQSSLIKQAKHQRALDKRQITRVLRVTTVLYLVSTCLPKVINSNTIIVSAVGFRVGKLKCGSRLILLHPLRKLSNLCNLQAKSFKGTCFALW